MRDGRQEGEQGMEQESELESEQESELESEQESELERGRGESGEGVVRRGSGKERPGGDMGAGGTPFRFASLRPLPPSGSSTT